jgi:hypothetical protein
MRNPTHLLARALIAFLFASLPAQAATVSGVVGLDLSGGGKGNSNGVNYGPQNTAGPLLGLEISQRNNPATEVGIFYDHNIFRSYADGSGQNVTGFAFDYGIVVRLGLALENRLFIEGKVGAMDTMAGQASSHGPLTMYGIGFGYRIPVTEKLDISPRIASRSSGNFNIAGGGLSVSSSFVDIDAMVSYSF